MYRTRLGWVGLVVNKEKGDIFLNPNTLACGSPNKVLTIMLFVSFVSKAMK